MTEDTARGGFFLVSGTAISTVIMAIASILVARLLGPEFYGQYALALVVPQLLFLFTDLGINSGIVKFSAAMRSTGETNRISTIIKHGLIIRASIGIAISIANYTLSGIIASNILQRPELAFYMQIASIAILFQVVFSTVTFSFIGLYKTEYHALTTNIMATAKTIVSIALILVGLSITGAIIGYTVSYVIASLAGAFLLFLLLRKVKTPAKTDSFKTNAKTLFQYGTPLYISVILAGFLPLFINIMLALFTTDAAIGNYKAAINFATLLTVLAVPITTVLLPAFSKLNSTTSHKTKDFFKIANKYATMLVIPITFLIIIFSNEIVQIIYGSTYTLASPFLSTYCLLYALVGVGYLILPSLYNGLGKTKITLKMNLITFTAVIILSWPLTQAYGVQGIIAAFIIANTIGTLYGTYIAKRNFQVEFDVKNLTKIYIISAISGAIPLLLLNFTKLQNIINLVAGGVIYLLSYIALLTLANVVTPSELEKIAYATRNTQFLSQLTQLIVKYQQKILQLKNQIKNKDAIQHTSNKN